MNAPASPSIFAKPEGTISLPETYREFREDMSDSNKAVLAVITASGKPLGAYYARDTQGHFNLHKQASVDTAAVANFPPTANFNETNLDHIAVRDSTGELKGFFVVAQQDLSRYAPQGYDPQKFVNNYLTPPYEMQKANHDLAAYIAQEYAPHLFPENPAPTRTAEQRNEVLQNISRLMDVTHTAGTPLPDSNLSHTRGVSAIARGLADASNAAATERGLAVPYDVAMLETTTQMGLLHDLGKVQIPMRLNDYQFNEYLAPEDKTKTPEEIKSIRRAQQIDFTRENHNHPFMTDLILTLINPAMSQAAAEHHLNLFREWPTEEARKGLGDASLLHQDHLAAAKEIPFISQMFRVADVGDACINHTGKPPSEALQDLYNQTKERMSTGLPKIDPDILGFMIARGVYDDYLKTKTLPPKKLNEDGTRPLDTKVWPLPAEQQAAYEAEKQRILTEMHYAENKDRIETRILTSLAKEPMLTAHREELAQAQLQTPIQEPSPEAKTDSFAARFAPKTQSTETFAERFQQPSLQSIIDKQIAQLSDEAITQTAPSFFKR